jgi:HEAT repeat protein
MKRIALACWLLAAQLAGGAEPQPAAELRKLAGQLAAVDKLLADLGSPDFAAREAATRRLMELPLMPRQKLESLAADAEPETQFRIRQILLGEPADVTPIMALVERVREEKIAGLTQELLTILEFAGGDAKLAWTFEQALLATACADDVELLATALRSPAPAVRSAAIGALANLHSEPAAQALVAHREEGDEATRLALAEGLAKLGRRESLPMLIGLLTSPDKARWTRAAIVLESVTGRADDSLAGSTLREREASAAAWRAWLAEQPDDLRLRPLEATGGTASPFDD